MLLSLQLTSSWALLLQIEEVTRLLHKHGALSFWDYAGGGPYMDIKMTNPKDPELNIDAVYLSPHKFIGAAGGTPGVLVAKRCLFTNDVPTLAGGGTVR